MNAEMQNFKRQYLAQLKKLGTQVDQIAEQLRSRGNESGANKLFQLGNELEHFFDEWNHFDEFGRRDQTTGLSERNQESQ